MSLTEILEQVVKLNPAEQEQVVAKIRGRGEVVDSQEVFLLHLLKEGLISRIPPRKDLKSDFKPIRIKGRPLSKTIIEERR